MEKHKMSCYFRIYNSCKPPRTSPISLIYMNEFLYELRIHETSARDKEDLGSSVK